MTTDEKTFYVKRSFSLLRRWTVRGRWPGGSHWIADCWTRKDAERMAERLNYFLSFVAESQALAKVAAE